LPKNGSEENTFCLFISIKSQEFLFTKLIKLLARLREVHPISDHDSFDPSNQIIL